MTRMIMLAPAIMLVAACSRAPAGIQPGMWEYEVTTTAVEAPGLPAEALQQAQAGLGQPQRSRECVTPEGAANPLREVREQLTRSQNASCQTSDDVFAGGVIRFRATCRGSGGQGQLQLTLDGGFAAITLLADISVDAEVPNPNGSGTLSLRTRGTIKGRRIGNCARG